MATYAPFGTPVAPSGTEKFKYAGEMLVGAAGPSPGLYYIGARWMDPELGRFISLDPQLGSLSSPQTMNRYVYCANNPLRFTDPTGELFWVAIGALVGAVVGVVVYAITTPQSEWTWQEAGAAALGGAIAGAVTALTFNPAVGMAAASGVVGSGVWATVAGGAMAGAVGGALGGAAEYLAEGGFNAVSGKPFEWSAEGFLTKVGFGGGFGALGGMAGAGAGKAVGKLSVTLTSRAPASAGAALASQLPEEMISQVVEWFARSVSGLEDALARYTAIGVFPEGFLTAQSTIIGTTTISTFTK